MASGGVGSDGGRSKCFRLFFPETVHAPMTENPDISTEKTILKAEDPAFARWYSDGEINITYNMFDRYLPTHNDKKALIWVSNSVQQERIWTLRQAY